MYSSVISVSSYLPELVFTNKDIERIFITTNKWIVKRTGIYKRHLINSYENSTIMAYKVSKLIFNNSNILSSEIGMIICVTCTPDNIFPSTACLIQDFLNLKKCFSFDIQAACCGFIYALNIADQFIKNKQVKFALVVATESMSEIVNWNDRKISVLFGDGAGAFLLGFTSIKSFFLSSLFSDGKYHNLLYLKNNKKNIMNYLIMDGKSIFKLAVKFLEDTVINSFKKNKLNLFDMDWIIPHQANFRIVKLLSEKLKFPFCKMVVALDSCANVASASIPISFDFFLKNSFFCENQNLLMISFGGGVVWGFSLMKFKSIYK